MPTAFKQVKNNAKTTAVLNVLNNATTTLTFAVHPGEGAKFPTPGNGFYITAYNRTLFPDPGDDPDMRIGLVTAVSGDDFTVTWGQFGTPVNPIAGSPALELFIVAQHMVDIHTAINTAETNIGILSSNDTALGAAITTEASTRAAADTVLQNNINSLSSSVTAEASARIAADLLKQAKAVTVTVGLTGSGADYECDGVADNVQLQAAINYLISIGGGLLFVLAGTYDIQRRVQILGSNITVRGAGQATKFFLHALADQEIWLVGNGNVGDAGAGDGPSVIPCNDVHFYDFYMDGNKANQTQTDYSVVRYGNSATRNLIRYRSDAQTSYGGIVDNVHAINSRQNGISSESHAFVTIRNCIAENCDQFGIWFENGSQMLIAGNYTRNNVFAGMKGLSAGAKVVHNESKGDQGGGFAMQGVGGVFANNIAYRTGWQGATVTASTGFGFSLSDSMVIGNNHCYGAYGHGFVFNGIKRSSIVGNTARRNGQYAAATYTDFYMTFAGGGAPCNDNIIMANTCKNDTASFYNNKTAYNFSSDSPSAHSGNKFIGNITGEPATAVIYQLTQGNSFVDMKGVNPIGTYNYTYLGATQTIDPKDGSALIGTGYQNNSTVTIADGSFAGQTFDFLFFQDVGNKQITWAANVKWPGGKAPVFSGVPNTGDFMRFVWDGTNWNGTYSGNGGTRYINLGYLDNPQAIDPNAYDVFFGTGYSGTTTVNVANGRNQGQTFRFIFSQDVGNKFITWSANVRWPGGVAPTLSTDPNVMDIIMFTWDGTNWNGFIAPNFSKLYSVGGTDVAVADGGTGASTAAAARTNLGAAADSAVVHNTGAETVAGVKTFSSAPVVPSNSFPESAVTNLTTDLAAKAPIASPTFTGSVTLPGDPSTALQAATKQYVDAVASGLDVKNSVLVATTVAGTLATSFANGQTVDGVVLATGNRILIKNQASGAENGIYTVNASGAPTRATDADSAAEVTSGMFVFVSKGTANGSNGFVLTTDDPITLGTTALTFSQFSGAGLITAGAGLTKTGNQLDVVAGSSMVSVAADSIDVVPANFTGIPESGVTNLTSDLAAKAPLASPALTGTPTAPTAAQGTNTTQLATTAMVQSEVTLLAPKASPALTGTPTAPTAAAATNTTQLATTAHVFAERTNAATLTNKTLTSPVINTPTGIVKGDVGLGNADNTSDATKNSATATLSNKRVTRRVSTVTQSATPAINTDNMDIAVITGLAQAITSMTSSLTGTPTDGDLLLIRITDNGTARAIAWGASFESSNVVLPTTTVISTMLTVGLQYNGATSKWRCVAVV